MPIKDFANAKSRLGEVLTSAQCTALAEHMASDVIDALQASTHIAGITLLGAGPESAAFAAKHGCEFLPDVPGGLSENLTRATTQLAGNGIAQVLILPADLPKVTAPDIDALVAAHSEGLTVCQASCDAGTNALVVSPPDAISFQFGEHSARRHMEISRATGLQSLLIADGSFSRDVDRPDDLRWLCQQELPGRTSTYLDTSGIRGRMTNDSATLPA